MHDGSDREMRRHVWHEMCRATRSEYAALYSLDSFRMRRIAYI